MKEFLKREIRTDKLLIKSKKQTIKDDIKNNNITENKFNKQIKRLQELEEIKQINEILLNQL